MKKSTFLFTIMVAFVVSSCNSLKNTTPLSSNETWELEYISGPRIAFDGLFPNKKPQITFNTATSEVSGTTSCNGFTTKYTLKENNISFSDNFPMTKMYCEGGGEQVFLQTLQQVNQFSKDTEGRLELKKQEITLMRFRKVSQ